MSTAEFTQMVLGHVAPLHPFAMSLTRNQEDAKDLCQETLFKAIANKDKYAMGTNIRAWLFTIMRNVFINNYRRNSRQRVVLDGTPGLFLVNSAGGYAVNEGVSNLGMEEIKRAMARLPEIFRTPFEMYYTGYHYQEIADALQEPLGTIKSRIHIARQQLKRGLQRH